MMLLTRGCNSSGAEKADREAQGRGEGTERRRSFASQTGRELVRARARRSSLREPQHSEEEDEQAPHWRFGCSSGHGRVRKRGLKFGEGGERRPAQASQPMAVGARASRPPVKTERGILTPRGEPSPGGVWIAVVLVAGELIVDPFACRPPRGRCCWGRRRRRGMYRRRGDTGRARQASVEEAPAVVERPRERHRPEKEVIDAGQAQRSVARRPGA